MVGLAALYGVIASAGGLLLSFHGDIASGPAIILVACGIALLSLVFGPAGGLVPKYFPRPHLEA